MPSPVITLTTDFGTADHYVAQMKAALLTRLPTAQVIDVTHSIPRHSILPASFILERLVATFPPGTTHLAVVDPGVGSTRRLLITDVRSQRIICPDNGLITWTWHSHPGAQAYELTWRPPTSSHTFHGRDIMAPAAAQLASGTPVESLARPITDPILLPIRPATDPRGHVIHIDHYGNCTTNIPARLIPPAATAVRVGTRSAPLRTTYTDVPVNDALALIGSSDLLEIAVNQGSAAQTLQIAQGDAVHVE